MTRHHGSTAYRVQHWLEAGNTGTAPEIAAVLGSNLQTVQQALLSLKTRGAVEQLEMRVIRYGGSNGRVSSPVWGIRTAQDCGPLTVMALRRRTALEQAWGQA